ncbi:MAG: nitroreductase family protein [Bacilli bacterium]|nr:nitroreductase family protein [Bacilli bacterium]
MELRSAIESRRSIRKYKSDKIDNEIILEIIKEATHAASGHNRQPWKVKIVNDLEKEKIANTLYEKFKDVKGHTAPHTASVIREIPNLVVVYLDSDDERFREIDILSIGGMIDEILLLAEEKEIGTLWIANTNLIKDEIKNITNVNLETISCIGFGLKDQFPSKRPRKDFSDIVINN